MDTSLLLVSVKLRAFFYTLSSLHFLCLLKTDGFSNCGCAILIFRFFGRVSFTVKLGCSRGCTYVLTYRPILRSAADSTLANLLTLSLGAVKNDGLRDRVRAARPPSFSPGVSVSSRGEASAERRARLMNWLFLLFLPDEFNCCVADKCTI